MNIIKSILQNVLLGNKFIKDAVIPYYDTGGGKKDSYEYKNRAKRNSKIIIDVINNKSFKPKKILELGCGIYPGTLNILNKEIKPDEIFGCENRHINENVYPKVLPIEKILELNIKFDLIYSIDVLEHVDNVCSLLNTLNKLRAKKSLVFHSVDLRSHYHNVNSIHAFKHYKYNDFFWNMMTSNRSGYTNRFKLKNWIDIFKKYYPKGEYNYFKHSFWEEMIEKFSYLKEEDIFERVNLIEMD